MKRFLSLAVVALGTLAAPARADWLNYCVYGSYQVCTSVTITSVDNVVTMRVWNLSGMNGLGAEHTITALGLYHSGSSYNYQDKLVGLAVTHVGGAGDITNYWTTGATNDIKTFGGVNLELREGTSGNDGIVGCVPTTGGLKWATCNGGPPDVSSAYPSYPNSPYVQFQFTFAQGVNFSLDNVQLRWHSQQLPDGSSLKCDTGGAGGSPCAAVPEPTTIALVGTGLSGLLVARRRRKRAEKA